MMSGSYSAVTFRNLSYMGEDNFAMITLEMGDLSAMRTIRARRTRLMIQELGIFLNVFE